MKQEAAPERRGVVHPASHQISTEAMDTAATILIAIGLAMDAFAVSISGGVGLQKGEHRWPLVAGTVFGGFQAGMPVLGWLGGTAIAGFLGFYGPWIAFLLLVLIGGKMLLEAVRGDENVRFANLSAATILLLAVATSIDALAVGVSLAMLDTPILLPAAIIGIVTFAFSAAGVVLGRSIGRIAGRNAGVIGGVILIGIGLQILLEHLLI
ncbi:MAG TPA: manganese efflux pump MntP family protein [Methanoculleus sp.]|jgi:putative Mn2+ efflux pump MntP|nr:manganese efflux pump MntP family protein [Methanoculleus sp.]HUM77065.1 manganese efflux pump MntP family protein [Methanoculleus sp.]